MNRFHRLGTKHETYVNRLKDKYSSVNNFTMIKVDDNLINAVDSNGVTIDTFNSKATYNQFLIVLEALGMIKATASGYLIISNAFNWDYSFEAIFSVSQNEQIQNYRQSRKIAFLYALNLVNDEFLIKNQINKKHGDIKLSDIHKEISLWEESGKASYLRIIKFLERVKNEYKI